MLLVLVQQAPNPTDKGHDEGGIAENPCGQLVVDLHSEYHSYAAGRSKIALMMWV